MATVTLDRDECDEGFLPPVCIRCGEAATSVRNQHYQWVPPAIHLTMIFCVPYLILLLVMRKKMTVALPVCDRHRWIWRGNSRSSNSEIAHAS